MFRVNGFHLDGTAGLVQLTDLASREVVRSFPAVLASAPREAVFSQLRGSQLRVLTMVPLDGGRRLTELATIADMTKQAMGEFVADLAERGFVTVGRDPADGRAKLVSLTDAGREAAETAHRMLAHVEAHWAERLGAEDYATLVALLARAADVELDTPTSG
jgi:DNA-binding MarR family transcriptional regulator